MEISMWKVRLEMEREDKDQFFAGDWQSPLFPKDPQRFKGLVVLAGRPQGNRESFWSRGPASLSDFRLLDHSSNLELPKREREEGRDRKSPIENHIRGQERGMRKWNSKRYKRK